MKNALAVYTQQRSINGRQLVEIASHDSIAVRLLAPGGSIPLNAEMILSKALTTNYGGVLLVIGGFATDLEKLTQFDSLLAAGCQQEIAAMLNGGKLPWCELYTARFNNDKAIKSTPQDKSRLDNSAPKSQSQQLKAAKTASKTLPKFLSH